VTGVDATVWSHFLRGSETPEDHHLQQLIFEDRPIALTDLLYCEILQGIREDTHYERTRNILLHYPILRMETLETVDQGAKIYRACRRRGLTIRKTIDCLIASVCIENDFELFHNDSDFNLIAKATSLQIYRIPSA
jgi:predicted nucleic acid-binding protein